MTKTKNELTYICHFKIKVPYTIERRTWLELTSGHSATIGYASFDGETFTAHTTPKMGELIEKTIADGGGFSHSGDFDNRGIFILAEVSIVKYPRFETEGFTHDV